MSPAKGRELVEWGLGFRVLKVSCGKRSFLCFQREEREQMLVALLFSPISGGSALGVNLGSVGTFRDEQGDGLLASTLDSPMKGRFVVEVGHVREKALAK